MKEYDLIKKLMIPRYILIADYPNNAQAVGSIISSDEAIIDPTIWCETRDKYPNIFKKLGWWENRDINEMPDYVKNEKGIVKKVFKHYTYILTSGADAGEHSVPAVCSFDEMMNGFEKLFWRYDTCLPATIQEYLEYMCKLHNFAPYDDRVPLDGKEFEWDEHTIAIATKWLKQIN
jgi:hypothetical protein